MDVIFLDFRTAFHSVPHKRLLEKARSYGNEEPLITWLEAFLTKRHQRVIVNGAKLDWADILSGTPQGSVLGPTLFVIFINDLPASIHSSIQLCADVANVYGPAFDQALTSVIQKDQDSAMECSQLWLLPFNLNKCKTLHLMEATSGSHIIRGMQSCGK